MKKRNSAAQIANKDCIYASVCRHCTVALQSGIGKKAVGHVTSNVTITNENKI